MLRSPALTLPQANGSAQWPPQLERSACPQERCTSPADWLHPSSWGGGVLLLTYPVFRLQQGFWCSGACGLQNEVVLQWARRMHSVGPHAGILRATYALVAVWAGLLRLCA